MDNFLMLWDINLIFCIHTCHDNTEYSEKFFWNRMVRTSPTSLPSKNLQKWITSTKIVRFGWNLVCKLVLLPYMMMRTGPTSLPAENLRKWITSTKIVRFGWNLVCKSVLRPNIALRNFVVVGPLFYHPARPTRKLTYRKNFRLL